MKKIFISTLFTIFTISLFSQVDSVDENTLDEEYIEVDLRVNDTNNIFQYRISFNEINCKSCATDFKNYIKDSFNSDVDFNEITNQFIFTAKQDMTQGEITRNFALPLQCYYFKKINLKNLSYSN